MSKYGATMKDGVGTNILISVPPNPLSRNLRRRISEIVRDIEEIREAHFPEVVVMGSYDDAACVLFLVFRQTSKISAVMDSIGAELANVSEDEGPFEIWPISQSDSLLETIRGANCVIGWRD